MVVNKEAGDTSCSSFFDREYIRHGCSSGNFSPFHDLMEAFPLLKGSLLIWDGNEIIHSLLLFAVLELIPSVFLEVSTSAHLFPSFFHL